MAVSAVAASAVDAASVLASFAVVEAVPAAEADAAESVPFFSGKRIDFIPNTNKNIPARSTAEAVNAFIRFFSLRSFFLRNFFFRDIKQLLIENIALIGYLKKNAKR